MADLLEAEVLEVNDDLGSVAKLYFVDVVVSGNSVVSSLRGDDGGDCDECGGDCDDWGGGKDDGGVCEDLRNLQFSLWESSSRDFL